MFPSQYQVCEYTSTKSLAVYSGNISLWNTFIVVYKRQTFYILFPWNMNYSKTVESLLLPLFVCHLNPAFWFSVRKKSIISSPHLKHKTWLWFFHCWVFWCTCTYDLWTMFKFPFFWGMKYIMILQLLEPCRTPKFLYHITFSKISSPLLNFIFSFVHTLSYSRDNLVTSRIGEIGFSSTLDN